MALPDTDPASLLLMVSDMGGLSSDPLPLLPECLAHNHHMAESMLGQRMKMMQAGSEKSRAEEKENSHVSDRALLGDRRYSHGGVCVGGVCGGGGVRKRI